jgi:uncharacterized coiled-coil protein SlyX
MAVEDGSFMAIVRDFWPIGSAITLGFGGWVARGQQIANRIGNLEASQETADKRLAALERLVADQNVSAAVIEKAVERLSGLPEMIADLREQFGYLRGEISGSKHMGRKDG